MRWDNARFRGTCFIKLESDPTVIKIEENVT